MSAAVATAPVLTVKDLVVSYRRRGQHLPVLDGVSFEIGAGEALGLVGESGCGKSTVALTLMRYLARNGSVEGGSIRLDGEDLLALEGERLRAWRGKRIAMVYQEPASALNPSMRVGEQVAEVFRAHEGIPRSGALRRATEMLGRVALADPELAMRRYPHQLSGGQQQRVVIAMALAANPRLLILDEPTTGLDATVEAEVLDLIGDLRREFEAAILFISHNLGLVARVCERVGILYSGRVVEEGPAREVLGAPQHPYTLGLVRCVPRFGASKRDCRLEPIPGSLPPLGAHLPGCWFEPRCPLARDRCRESEPDLVDVGPGRRARCYFPDEVAAIAPNDAPVGECRPASGEPLLEIAGLRKAYDHVIACDDVSLDLRRGEVFGLVGESGSGKTTLVSCVAGLVEAQGGEMRFAGDDLPRRVGRRAPALRRRLQMVFQNPDTTLNPHHRTRYVLRRAIRRLGGAKPAEDLARDVRLDPGLLGAKTTQLSGGQKQRIAIARAFAGNPELVLCDEPVSALDVSVQAAILNLLAELQAAEGVSYIFISHDLSVVRFLADRIGVMYLGELVEVGPAAAVFSPPQHPYTEALLSAIPTLDFDATRERIRLEGPPPSLANPPSGCRFHTRCPRRLGEICAQEAPGWQDAGDGHRIKCHRTPEDLRELQAAAAPRPGTSAWAPER